MATAEPRQVIVVGVSAYYVVSWFARHVAAGVEKARIFDGYPADGPFQLFNILRRIGDSQAAGSDFNFFHGIGVPYVHMPVYWMFGSSVYSSELSRQLMSPLLFLVSSYCFCRAIALCRRHALVLTAVTLFTSTILGLKFVISAENSLVGVRSTMPVLFVALLARGPLGGGAVLRPLDGWVRGAFLAMALVLGTEQGIALIGAFAAIEVVSLLRWRLHERGYIPAVAGGFVGGLWIVLLVLAQGDVAGVLDVLRYNLVDVSKDQFWYFGSPPNNFHPALRFVFDDLLLVTHVVLLLCVTAVLVGVSARLKGPSFKVHALIVLVGYGAISGLAYFGIATANPLQPLERCLVLVALAGGYLALFAPRATFDVFVDGGSLKKFVRRAALPGLALVLLVPALGEKATYRGVPDAVEQSARAARDGFELGPKWQAYLDASKLMLGPAFDDCRGNLWSTYAGLLEAEGHCFNPSTDMIIHALGEDARREYTETFIKARPQFVQTIRRSFFPYEGWIQNTSWDFYEELLREYEPIGMTEYSLFWKLRDDRVPRPVFGPVEPVSFDDPADVRVQVPATATDASVVIVEIDYTIDNPFSAVPFFGATPRLLVFPEGTWVDSPFTVSPYRDRTRFAVRLRPDQRSFMLHFRIAAPIVLSSWEVTGVRVTPVTLPETQHWQLFHQS